MKKRKQTIRWLAGKILYPAEYSDNISVVRVGRILEQPTDVAINLRTINRKTLSRNTHRFFLSKEAAITLKDLLVLAEVVFLK